MNRAERRRQQKMAKKEAKNNLPGQVESFFPELQTSSLQEDLDLAIQHHTADRLPEAETLYQQILQTEPNHPDALHLLGVIALQLGKNDIAVDLITKALATRDDYPEAHSNLGNAFRELGQLDEAVTSYHRALSIKPNYTEVLSNLSVALQELGKLEEAVESCHKALEIKPDYAEAHYNLGNAQKELGQLDEAVANYYKTLDIKPDYAEAHYNLGTIFEDQGTLEEAIISYHKALSIKPDYAEAHNNLGNALQKLEQLEEAVASYHKTLAIKPDYAEAHSNLGNVLKELGRQEDAVTSYHKALDIKPDYAEAHSNLGIALLDLGLLDEAIESLHTAIELKPDYPEAHSHLGLTLQKLGRPDEAIVCYKKALASKPNFTEAHSNLGVALQDLGQLDEAVASYHKALEIKPDYAEVLSNLGNAFKELGKPEEAIASYQEALSIKPNYADAHSNLGTVLQGLGKLEKAISSYRKALDIKPDFIEAGRNLLYVILNVPGLSPGKLFTEHLRFSENHTRCIPRPPEDLTNDPNPNRRLRIGYLSSDFRDHPVGRNILPLLSSHDQEKFRVYCYAEVRHPDAITKGFRSCVDHWHTIVGRSDAEVASMVRADGIDILVCLAGRFDRNRPLVCAHRAAPVQVSYHDGATSGLKEMDYFVTDHFLNPPDTEEMFTEELHRLPVFYQYPPIQEAPPIVALPAEQAGFITFGSFNNPAKVNKEVIHLWAKVLRSVPSSRLLLKYKNSYELASLRDSVAERFSACGIGCDRIMFVVKPDTLIEHLGRYCEVDIALDPFPFNGTTTTFQALWMGVPVVSLAGETFSSRTTGSILHHVELGDLVADTPEAYVACAQHFAKDGARLKTLRATLRERITNSPLCDAPTYTRTVEAAYRDMWRKWCSRPKRSRDGN